MTGLVSSAGLTAYLGDLADTPVEAVRRVLDVVLLGALLCARRAAQVMSTAARRRGRRHRDHLVGGGDARLRARVRPLRGGQGGRRRAHRGAGQGARRRGRARQRGRPGAGAHRIHAAGRPGPAGARGVARPARPRRASPTRSRRRSPGCSAPRARTSPARCCASRAGSRSGAATNVSASSASVQPGVVLDDEPLPHRAAPLVPERPADPGRAQLGDPSAGASPPAGPPGASRTPSRRLERRRPELPAPAGQLDPRPAGEPLGQRDVPLLDAHPDQGTAPSRRLATPHPVIAAPTTRVSRAASAGCVRLRQPPGDRCSDTRVSRAPTPGAAPTPRQPSTSAPRARASSTACARSIRTPCHDHAVHVAPVEPGAPQIGPRQLRLAQPRARQVRPRQVCAPQVGTGQVGLDEPQPRQRHPAQVLARAARPRTSRRPPPAPSAARRRRTSSR